MPTITSLIPDRIPLDADPITVRVLGTGFTPESLILWDGDEVTTTYVSETELTTDIDPADAVISAEIPIRVVASTESEDHAESSNTQDFIIEPPFAKGA